jgi:hypothetical protein
VPPEDIGDAVAQDLEEEDARGDAANPHGPLVGVLEVAGQASHDLVADVGAGCECTLGTFRERAEEPVFNKIALSRNFPRSEDFRI